MIVHLTNEYPLNEHKAIKGTSRSALSCSLQYTFWHPLRGDYSLFTYGNIARTHRSGHE